MGIRVAVAGASGYAGGELLRLIAGHPHFELATATGNMQAGARLGTVHPHLVTLADHRLADLSQSLVGKDEDFAHRHGRDVSGR